MTRSPKDIKDLLLQRYQESGKEMFIDYDDPDITATVTTLFTGGFQLTAELISPAGKVAAQVQNIYPTRAFADTVAIDLINGVFVTEKDKHDYHTAEQISLLADKAMRALEHGTTGEEIAKLYVESAKLIIETR